MTWAHRIDPESRFAWTVSLRLPLVAYRLAPVDLRSTKQNTIQSSGAPVWWFSFGIAQHHGPLFLLAEQNPRNPAMSYEGGGTFGGGGFRREGLTGCHGRARLSRMPKTSPSKPKVHRHTWSPEEARVAAQRSKAARALKAVRITDPIETGNASLRRIVAVTNLAESELKKAQGREALEWAKVLMAGEQTVLDRTHGKPRPTPEGQALPDDYARAVREANKRAQALASSEGNSEDPDHKI